MARVSAPSVVFIVLSLWRHFGKSRHSLLRFSSNSMTTLHSLICLNVLLLTMDLEVVPF